jgi:hypothetical protein
MPMIRPHLIFGAIVGERHAALLPRGEFQQLRDDEAFQHRAEPGLALPQSLLLIFARGGNKTTVEEMQLRR